MGGCIGELIWVRFEEDVQENGEKVDEEENNIDDKDSNDEDDEEEKTTLQKDKSVTKKIQHHNLNLGPIATYCHEVWTDPDKLKLHVLVDFFKHGFDGDGDDGGSCIDGRLTSAWNWCSKIAKKPYYYAFTMNGFQGFDGEFKD